MIKRKKTSQTICILYSQAKREYFPTQEQFITEEEVYHRATLIAKYLDKMGMGCVLYPGDERLAQNLRSKKIDIVMNLVDSIRGQEDLAPVIPATLELLDMAYTGSGVIGLAINANKFFTKTLLFQNGIPVPKFQLFNNPSDRLDQRMHFPLIVKLNEIHGSVEINDSSIVENERDLKLKISSLMSVYKQPVLVEEFIAGQEVTILIIDGVNKKIYPGERVFSNGGKYKIVSFAAAWGEKDEYTYRKFATSAKLKQDVKKAFDVLKMDDYARFDLRVDQSGRYYFIDANANPALGPKEAQCAFATLLELYDISFEDALLRLIKNSLKDLK